MLQALQLNMRRCPIDIIKHMHEFLRDTSVPLKYEQCKSCETRTQMTCIRCSFCWSCHWKQEVTTIRRYLLVS